MWESVERVGAVKRRVVVWREGGGERGRRRGGRRRGRVR